MFAAEGWGKCTGDVGVCIATSGPGATNLVTGLADALLDSVPMVAITGQVPRPMIGTDAFQETPIVEITRQITKHNYLVLDVKDLPRILKEAFYLARTGRPGPVLVDVPKDIQQQLAVRICWPQVAACAACVALWRRGVEVRAALCLQHILCECCLASNRLLLTSVRQSGVSSTSSLLR